MKAPRNCWYVAAWSGDVGRGLLARTVLGAPMVLYRTAAGAPVALADRCPHRFAPLSMGRREGDSVRCAYHGLVFDAAGACRHVPGQRTVPPGTRVARYPAVDRWGWTWVWPGEAARADPAAIPDFHWNEAPGWATTGGEIRIGANYMLLVDNLLDLSHEAYLHPRTIGNAAVAEDARVRTERGESGVRVTRWTLDCPTPPLWREIRGHEGNIDRWQIVDFVAPSSVLLESGSAAAGTVAPDGDRAGAVTHMAMFAITPETETSSHYFWSNARNHRIDEAAVTEALRQGILKTFQEDAEMLEAQQRAIARDPAAAWIDLNVDQGALQARRIVARMLAGEDGGAV